MSLNDKFLDSYKALETELRLYENKTVLDYENELTGTFQEKLKSCRIMRNYMSHNDTSFLQASNEQIKFLNDVIIEIRKKAHTVKDEFKKSKLLKPTTSIKEVIQNVNKFGYAVIKSKQGYFIVDSGLLIYNLAKNNKKIEIPKKLPKVKFTAKTVRLQMLDGLYIVTSDGTVNGQYLGIIDV